METTHHLLGYYADRHCSRQWRSFLLSLAQELEALTTQDELRALMRQVGKRMAGGLPLAGAATLRELQAAMNQQWDRIGWGWVSLEEKPAFLLIKHSAAPLHAAFGARGLSWSPDLLAGIYEHWFAQAGAREGFSVSRYSDPTGGEDALTFDFRLLSARQPEQSGTNS